MPINSKLEKHNIVICANIFVRKGNKYLLIERSPKKKEAPGYVQPIGGKVKLSENPYEAALRELKEEAGISATNLKIEAVITEVHPKSTYGTWLIFNFSGEAGPESPQETEEGKLLWLTPQEIKSKKLIFSIKETLEYILDSGKGTVFAKFNYDKDYNLLKKEIDVCIV